MKNLLQGLYIQSGFQNSRGDIGKDAAGTLF